jgi:hypothetical protein
MKSVMASLQGTPAIAPVSVTAELQSFFNSDVLDEAAGGMLIRGSSSLNFGGTVFTRLPILFHR